MFKRGSQDSKRDTRNRIDRVTRRSNEESSKPRPASVGIKFQENVIHLDEVKRDRAAAERKIASESGSPTARVQATDHFAILPIKNRILPFLLDRIDAQEVADLTRPELRRQIRPEVMGCLDRIGLAVNAMELDRLVEALVDELLGLGPLEPLLADDSITDILVNGPKRVYVERNGKLEITDVTLRDDAHVMHIATRIATSVGRRIDMTRPMVDARLKDGSRVNVIVPPLALNGPTISIRKFARDRITLDRMVNNGSLSKGMATLLTVAARCRLNTLVCGGTGSGKTTMLNALSEQIDPAERIVTIEDAAELQLQQEHTVRLETRLSSIEGDGEISMRHLVKNALRMRPDRIILGEVRGGEAFDMLQAMNTGHDGSLGTIHANNPREALTRLENMVGMAATGMSPDAIHRQVCDAIDLIVHVERFRDGIRRVKNIEEIVGLEGNMILTQNLFRFDFKDEDSEGRIRGDFKHSGTRPEFVEKAHYYGLEEMLLAALT